MALADVIQEIEDARVDAQSLENFIFQPANVMVERRLAPPVNTLQYYVDYMSALAKGRDGVDAAITSLTVATGAAGTAASVVTGGTPTARTFALTIPRGDKGLDGSFTQKSYTTYALMDADKLNIPANTSVTVTNDTDTTKNGMYAYNGTAFTKSVYDPVALAAADATTKANAAQSSAISVASQDATTKANNAKTQAVSDSKNYTDTLASNTLSYTSTSKSILDVRDKQGNKVVDIKGVVSVSKEGGVETGAISLAPIKSFKYVHAVSDSKGNILYGVNNKGQFVADFSLVNPPKPVAEVFKGYDAEINHVLAYGQSLAAGQSLSAISTTQKYDNLMFTRGMRPQHDYISETPDQWYAGLIPAVEAVSPLDSSMGETPCMGTGDAIKELILNEDGFSYADMNYQMMLSAPAWGGVSIAALSRGTSNYAGVIDQVSRARTLSLAQNKEYKVQAITWTQGESDPLTSDKVYYADKLRTLISDFNIDIKAITKQKKDVRLISYQVSTHKRSGRTVPDIALGQLAASISDPNVFLATPTYFLEYLSSDNYHIYADSERWLGAYYGLAYKRVVIDGGDWQPVRPLSSFKSGKFVNVVFNVPKGKLVFDTTQVALNTNYGFGLVTAAGVALPITSVTISNINTVKIMSSVDIPDGAFVRYAWTGTTNTGRITGPRGNLRDTQGNDIVFDPQGINKPMHNWCVIFELEI